MKLQIINVPNYLLEVQKTSRLADNPKRQRLVGGGLERAPLPFSGFQRAEPFGGYEVEKKSGESFLLGEGFICPRFSERNRQGVEGICPRTIEVCSQIFVKNAGKLLLC